MRLFRRRRTPEVRAELPVGFWLAETRAMQQSIRNALRGAERHLPAVPALLELSPGAEGRVVAYWRNHLVGFVPAPQAAELRRQLTEDSILVVDGQLREYDAQWRIWAGPAPSADAPEPEVPVDELEPPRPTVFGIPLRDRESRATARAGRPARAEATRTVPAPPGPAPTRAEAATTGAKDRRILAIDSQSWDISEGQDLTLLRRRLGDAAPGDTIHARLWETPVTVHLTPDTRVTITDPHTGAVELVHPREV